MIADALQRAAAIDVTRSCIIQAPAGSGKTELLIQRILALLGQVERPQQILAITFTNKAAAEMRERVLNALERARCNPCPETAHEKVTWQLAQVALQRHGEGLLRNPAQLAIQTIDSFNAQLVGKMPWLSRFGTLPEIADDATPLYLQAAENLLDKVSGSDSCAEMVGLLLRHLDNNVDAARKMLVSMLRRRDQWLRHLLDYRENGHRRLQRGLENLCDQYLWQLHENLPRPLVDELLFCLNHSLQQREDQPAHDFFNAIPGSSCADLPGWLSIAELLLTTEDKLRKTVNKNNGFPPSDQEAKGRMTALLDQLDNDSPFIRQLAAVRHLPGRGYSAEQLRFLDALIELLPLLVAELWLVFRNRSQADFAAIALQAQAALGGADNPTELLLQIDHDLQHILIDEFQDTSRLQYRLLETVTAGWEPGDGRTLFLVGDPMQSIYLFREAEVGLFLDSFNNGAFGSVAQLPLERLQLRCNFRSQEGIVDWVNSTFDTVFPAASDVAQGAVPLTEAVAVKPLLGGEACRLHPFVGVNDRAEAEKVVELVEEARAEDPDQNIAILVRSRTHLRDILPLLRRHRIDYLAKDIDALEQRPVALDIVHLTRALLHRGDQLSWLAVLRAPWCGLTLTDLTRLTTTAGAATLPACLIDTELRATLSADGQARLKRVWPILQAGLARRGRLPLRQLVEGCWLALGGPACCDAEGRADALLVFALLDSLDRGGDLESFELLDQGLKKLFATPDSDASGRLQIMTIHKAKGLEFDTVIIPGLGKTTGGNDAPLLRWFEHPDYGLLLGPVAAKGSPERDPVYQLIKRLEDDKGDHETARLLYVATTRAARRLHLLGHAKIAKNGTLSAAKGSLLEKLWPVVHSQFEGLEIRDDNDSAAAVFPAVKLRRLVPDWSPPELAPLSFAIRPTSKTASETAAETIFSGWENPLHRHVGTLVHQQLERLALHGLEPWHTTPRKQLYSRLKEALSRFGVAAADLDGGVARVVAMIDMVVAGQRGQWLLTDHAAAACELPLSGLVDGQLVHAVIDRTFIADGQRWIVDYKTSAPVEDETEADFLCREGDHYRSQLDIYAKLMALRDSSLPIRSALYFPAFDGWYEY